MTVELKTAQKVVGIKQTNRAISEGKAKKVFLALDADTKIISPLVSLCRENHVPIEQTFTMKELGIACGIDVGASALALL